MSATSRTVKVKFDGEARGLDRAAKEGERDVDRFAKNTERSITRAGERASRGFLAAMRRGFGKLPDEGTKTGEQTGKRFGSGMKKWITGEGGGLFKQIGENGGTVFGSGLLGAIKTPILGPALLATFGAAVAVSAPAVGAIAGAGLVAGFGAGLAGLGIVFAAKSERVQQAWQKTMAQAGSDVQLWSRPFEDTLVNISGYFERTVSKFGPSLERSFGLLAPVVDKFADRFLTSTERLAPALEPMSRAFDKVLARLSPALDSLFEDLSAGVIGVASSVERGAGGLADLTEGAGDLIGNLLQLIVVLNDANTGIETATGGVSAVDAVMAALNGTLAPAIVLFGGLSRGIDLFNAAIGRTGKDSANAGKSMSDAANNTVKLAQGITQAGGAATSGAPPMRTLAERMEAARQKAAAQAAAFEDLISKMFRVQNLALGLSGAQINLQAALDKASAAVKENGKSLDINSEKGRANRLALNEVAQSANAQTEAMIRSGHSQDTAGLAAIRSRANFVKLAQQMGATKPQAEAMARSMIAIPNVSRTAKLLANKADLDAKLAAAKKQLADPKLTAEKRAKLLAEIANLESGVARAKQALASVPSSKTVSININTYARRIESTTVGGIPAGIKAPRASGGYVGPGRRWVGERGPEILELGQNQSGRIINGEGPSGFGGQSAPIHAEIHIEIGGEVVRVVRTEIKADKRDLKRKVTAR